ncbi:MAG: XRE family transcriptional regulator [Tissierellia bacterium]|nr:XRE family transcriptional regulator [Tissierellia bacterium]
MEIGDRLRQIRIQLGLTQEELAERSELTKGFISQIERDLTSPSVDSLDDILEALGTNLSDFFKEESKTQIVFKEEDFFVSKDDELGVEISWIVPNAQKNDMEPIRVKLDKKGRTKIYQPYEGEEFGYVLKGSLEFIIGDNIYNVSEGECFYNPADKTRKIKNSSEGITEFLWISSPPGF